MKKFRWFLAVAFLAGCGSERVDQVTRKPVASFKATQSSARPQLFNLDASGSYATVGELKHWYWTFGDEQGAPRSDLSSATALHAYASPGDYSITLVVGDDKGAESEPFSLQVNVPAVNSELPQARITGPANGAPGAPLSFDGTGSTPAADLQNFVWNFGDLGSATGNTVSGKDARIAQHSFSVAGLYKVTLTVTDSLGQSDTAEYQVPISSAGPLAVCTFTPQPPLLGVPVTFDGSQSTPLAGSTIQSWKWDFGDGSALGAGQTATHSYNVLATFKPRLQVTDSQSRVGESNCPDLVVSPAPLCTGNYALSANPATLSGACMGSSVTWGGNKLNVVQSADGGMVATEALPSSLKAPDGGSTATYSGSYSGVDFTLQGAYVQGSGIGSSQIDVTVNGKLAGCESFKGTWNEKVGSAMGTICSYTFNVTGAKL